MDSQAERGRDTERGHLALLQEESSEKGLKDSLGTTAGFLEWTPAPEQLREESTWRKEPPQDIRYAH